MKKIIALLTLLTLTTISYAQPWAAMLNDACKGSCGSYPSFFCNFNNKLYYASLDNAHGFELWSTDGTRALTRMVIDLNTGTESSTPCNFTVVDSKLFFVATKDIRRCLFISDGTSGGTVGVNTVFPQFSSKNILGSMAAFNNELYFTATDDNSRKGLWKSDGTVVGTVFIAPISKPLLDYKQVGNKLFVIVEETGDRELWVTDGTAAGTMQIPSAIGVQQGMQEMNGKLYFRSENTSAGTQTVSVTDGTIAGTDVVGTYDFVLSALQVLNNQLYYVAANDVSGTGSAWLYSSSGAGNAQKVIETFSLQPGFINIVNNKIVVLTENALFISDGTQRGTNKIKDLPSGADIALTPAVCNNRLYFAAVTSGIVWSTDGTAAGTGIVDSTVSAQPHGKFGNYSPFIVANDKVYFEGVGISYRPLQVPFINGRWALRYVDANNKMHSVQNNITTRDAGFDYGMLGSNLYLAANDSLSGIEVWKLTDFATGIKETTKEATASLLYPNPANNTFSLRAGNAGNTMVSVYNFTGQLLLQTQQTKNISIANLPVGAYIVRVVSDGVVSTEKLVKQ